MMMMAKSMVMGMFKMCSPQSAANLATSSSKMMIIFFSTTTDSPLPLLTFNTSTPIITAHPKRNKSRPRCLFPSSLVREHKFRRLKPRLVKLMAVFEFPFYNLSIAKKCDIEARLNSVSSLSARDLSGCFASFQKDHKWEHISSFFLEWISLNPDHTDIELFNFYLLSAIMLREKMQCVMDFVVQMEDYIGSSPKTYSILFRTSFERGDVGFDEIFCRMQKKGHLMNMSYAYILDTLLKRNDIDFAVKVIEDGLEFGCIISLGNFVELVRVSVMQNKIDTLVSCLEKLKVQSYLRGDKSPPWWLCKYMIGVARKVKNNKLACIATDFINTKIDEED